MPQNPVDSFINNVQKIQQIHNKAEQLRKSLDSIDPLQKVTETVNDISEKINELDSAFAKTRRRTRRSPPRKE